MMTRKIALSTVLLGLLALGGCGDGGSDAKPSTAITITPSLGRIVGADVRLYDAAGAAGAEIGQGVLDNRGEITLDPSKPLPDGFTVKVFGKAGATYFDEALGADRPFPAGAVLSAAVADESRRVTVTALTTIAHERARALAGAGKPLTAALIRQANQETAAALGGNNVTDITAPVTLVGSPDDHPDAATPAGKHAYLLAALADYAASQHPDCVADTACDPLLDMVKKLADDFSDGLLNGKQATTDIDDAFYVTNGGASADNLRISLTQRVRDFAENGFTPTARWLARSMQGEYPLHCAPTAQDTGEPNARLTIGKGGGWLLSGGWGSMAFGGRSALLEWKQIGDIPEYWQLGRRKERRMPRLTPPGAAFGSKALFSTCNTAPKRDGVSISITPDGCFPQFEVILTRISEVIFNGNGYGQVRSGGNEWQCTGFPSFPDRTRISAEKRLQEWLPDGNYDCRTEAGAPDTPVSVSAGVLKAGALELPLASLTDASEVQRDRDDDGLQLNENVSSLLLGGTVNPRLLDSARYLTPDGNSVLIIHRAVPTGAFSFSLSHTVPNHPEQNVSRNRCFSTLPPQ
ncbi:hypothetical protein EV700_0990 [Fluviicoccus keumensis]|uniref:Lipoprotein n=1 Tax=Fluviicoccus keumensis TaxID=1435465 RepID=A0A4Q7ZDP2_9GAMM|nr:hypothetical protein [Fluviicoccus keumensis]RZU48019.1 hypothetical protein EV700_0990 [Fluviicoccus keumensis]